MYQTWTLGGSMQHREIKKETIETTVNYLWDNGSELVWDDGSKILTDSHV